MSELVCPLMLLECATGQKFDLLTFLDLDLLRCSMSIESAASFEPQRNTLVSRGEVANVQYSD